MVALGLPSSEQQHKARGSTLKAGWRRKSSFPERSGYPSLLLIQIGCGQKLIFLWHGALPGEGGGLLHLITYLSFLIAGMMTVFIIKLLGNSLAFGWELNHHPLFADNLIQLPGRGVMGRRTNSAHCCCSVCPLAGQVAGAAVVLSARRMRMMEWAETAVHVPHKAWALC